LDQKERQKRASHLFRSSKTGKDDWPFFPPKLVAFHRWENGGPRDDVVVGLNFANRSYPSYAIGFPRGDVWRGRFNSDWNGYSADFGNTAGYDTTAGLPGSDGLPGQGNFGIGPYTALVLSQDG
jgi:1,4-alpha-glucan branching enzyme